jgi:hypothetical protein
MICQERENKLNLDSNSLKKLEILMFNLHKSFALDFSLAFHAMGWDPNPYLKEGGKVDQVALRNFFLSKEQGLQQVFLLNYPRLFTKEFLDENT